MVDAVVGDGLAVPGDAADGGTLGREVPDDDVERGGRVGGTDVEGGLADAGGPELVPAVGGVEHVEAERREDVPGAHLAAVVVAVEAVAVGAVGAGEDLTDGGLRLRGSADAVVEVREVVAGLIAVEGAAGAVVVPKKLNKINKIIIKLRPAVSWFINFFDDFLLILTDLNFFLISATLGIAQTSLALLSLARDFYAEGV